MKFYAVRHGRQQGIFTSWDETMKQVKNFPGSKFKSFHSELDAQRWLYESQLEETDFQYILYTDGSYNYIEHVWSGASILLKDGKVISEQISTGKDGTYSYQNITGECMAVMRGLKDLESRDPEFESCLVKYDMSTLSLWVEGLATARDPLPKRYKNFIHFYRNLGKRIEFKKIYSHTGEKWNEKVDQLARLAIDKFLKKS